MTNMMESTMSFAEERRILEIAAGPPPPVLRVRRRTTKRYGSGGRVPTPRATQSEAELRRQYIRAAAAQMIAERGILRVTIRDVARAMRLNGESLCQFYSKREELLADIMVAHLDVLMRRVCDAYDHTAAETAVRRLQAIIGAFLAAALEQRQEHQ